MSCAPSTASVAGGRLRKVHELADGGQAAARPSRSSSLDRVVLAGVVADASDPDLAVHVRAFGDVPFTVSASLSAVALMAGQVPLRLPVLVCVTWCS